MKIAIIGAGIAGLGAARLLHPAHEITVYEANAYAGGHSRTIDIDIGRGNGPQPLDTGFIVFNDWNYPNLTGLFDWLGVGYEKSDMSFGVSIGEDGWLEYSSSALFAQKGNLLRGAYWKMLADILRFNRRAETYLAADPSVTLGQCLDALKMGDWFRRYYLLAMGAAIWSMPLEAVLDYPAATYLRFFKNHGLLNVVRRPQWYTVSGGSREYVRRLIQPFQDRLRLSTPVRRIRREGTGWAVTDAAGETAQYDRVVCACHADEAAALIEDMPGDLAACLGAFRYQQNRIVVHSDERFMPRRRKSWASWVYLDSGAAGVSLSYWMNNLQNFKSAAPVIVTLNPARMPRAELVYDTHSFAHPVFDEAAIRAQRQIESLQGRDGLWFCGAYQRYGFHEDGLHSAVKVAEDMGMPVPWR